MQTAHILIYYIIIMYYINIKLEFVDLIRNYPYDMRYNAIRKIPTNNTLHERKCIVFHIIKSLVVSVVICIFAGI